MDFQLLLIYSRVNCCTARGLAVGVGAEPSGCLAGHVVLRLSWLLQLPGPGFKLQANTCRGPSALSLKGGGKTRFHCPLAPLCSLWGPRLHVGAELDLVTGSSGLPLWLGPTRGFCDHGVLPTYVCHLNCVSPPVWEYFMEEKESTMTQGYPVAVLQATSRAPRGLRLASTVTHAWLCPATETNEKVWPSAAVCFSWHAVVQGACCGTHLSYLVP